MGSNDWRGKIKIRGTSGRAGGFTLLELLLVTSLLALIGLAIFSTFSRGLAVWQRGSQNNTAELKARFALEKFGQEFRNSFKFSGLEFSGARDQITFPTIVNSSGIAEKPRWQVGRVSYFFDSGKNSVFRRGENYVDTFQSGRPPAEEVIPRVKDFQISYYYYDYLSGIYKWMDFISDSDRWPSGVKIEFTLAGEKEKTIVKTVYLPQ